MMNLLSYFGLHVMDSDLIGWIVNDLMKNNDFKVNWCVGCKKNEKLWKTLYGNLDSGLEIEYDGISVYSQIVKLQFSP